MQNTNFVGFTDFLGCRSDISSAQGELLCSHWGHMAARLIYLGLEKFLLLSFLNIEVLDREAEMHSDTQERGLCGGKKPKEF